MLQLNNNFIFSCGPCSFAIFINFILFVHNGHANFDFKQCSIFTDVVFSFEKGSDSQNRSSSDFHNLMILPPLSLSHHLGWGRGGISPIPYCCLENPDIFLLILRTVLYPSTDALWILSSI